MKCLICGSDVEMENVCIAECTCDKCLSNEVRHAEMVERGKHLYKTMQDARRIKTVLTGPDGIEHNFKSRKEAFEFVAAKTGRTFFHCKKMFYVKDSFAGFTIKNFK